MPTLTWEVVVAVSGWLVSTGLAAWVIHSRKLNLYEDLDKRYVKIEVFNKDLGGFREAMSKQVDSSCAQAGLALKIAESALAKATEISQTLREVHERELKELADQMKEQGTKMETIMHQMIRLNTQFSERFPKKGLDYDDSR
jgi:biopolymer transport protein ExbB/TolQ